MHRTKFCKRLGSIPRCGLTFKLKIMEFIFTILMCILWGYICYKMAEKRHRDTTFATILGALFGIFAVIGYAIAGDA